MNEPNPRGKLAGEIIGLHAPDWGPVPSGQDLARHDSTRGAHGWTLDIWHGGGLDQAHAATGERTAWPPAADRPLRVHCSA